MHALLRSFHLQISRLIFRVARGHACSCQIPTFRKLGLRVMTVVHPKSKRGALDQGKSTRYRPYALMANVNLIGCLRYRITTDYNGFIDVFASNRGRFMRYLFAYSYTRGMSIAEGITIESLKKKKLTSKDCPLNLFK